MNYVLPSISMVFWLMTNLSRFTSNTKILAFFINMKLIRWISLMSRAH